MNSKKIILIVAIIAIIFENVYADSTSDCLNQLKDQGQYNLSYNSTEAFKHTINTYMASRDIDEYKNLQGILFGYHQHIYNEGLRVVNKLDDPMRWCLKSKDNVTPQRLQLKSHQKICEDDIRSNKNFQSAATVLSYAVFNNFINKKHIRETFINYTLFIRDTLPINLTRALGPQRYCEKFAPRSAVISSSVPINLELSIGLPNVSDSHYYAEKDCLDQLQHDGGYNLNSNSTEAFKHTIDYFIPYRKTNGFKQLKSILMHYHTHIYTYAAMVVNNIQDPMNWCMANIEKLVSCNLDLETRQLICNKEINSKKHFGITQDTLYYVIFNNISHTNINPTLLSYIEYMKRSLPICNTDALGPQNFCKKYGLQYPASSFSTPINLELKIGPSNMTNHHYNIDSEPTSATTSAPKETLMYTFMPTKEEEENRNNKRKKI